MCIELRHHPTQQIPAVDITKRLVTVWKVPADIAQTRRAEQGVAQSVQQYVAIGVRFQALCMWHVDTTQPQMISGFKRVNIKALTDSNKRPCCRRYSSASGNRGA